VSNLHNTELEALLVGGPLHGARVTVDPANWYLTLNTLPSRGGVKRCVYLHRSQVDQLAVFAPPDIPIEDVERLRRHEMEGRCRGAASRLGLWRGVGAKETQPARRAIEEPEPA